MITVLERMNSFSEQFGRKINVNGATQHSNRLGASTPVFWLTGGLCRAALGFAFIEKLAERHTVIAPDYPPVQAIGEFVAAFDAILDAEGVGTFTLGGKSYGGLLAQAYLTHQGNAVERLVLSSTGPANLSKVWLPVEYVAIAFVRFIPEKTVKNLLTGELLTVVTVPEAERAEWVQAVNFVMQNDLTCGDAISQILDKVIFKV